MKVKDRHALRRARIQAGYSQRELGFLCGRSQSAVSQLESGLMNTLSDDFALAIALRVRIPWEQLFEDHRPTGNPKNANDNLAPGGEERLA